MRWLRANGQKKSYNNSISQIIAKTNKKNLALMWLMRRVEVIALSLRPAEMTAEKYKCKCFDDVRLYENCWMLASCQWTDINCHLSFDCFLNNQTEHWKEKDREKAINLNFGKYGPIDKINEFVQRKTRFNFKWWLRQADDITILIYYSFLKLRSFHAGASFVKQN